MSDPSPVSSAADALRAWADRVRLTHVAFRLYRNWAAVLADKTIDGENYHGLPIRDVAVEFAEQALVFRGGPDGLGPHVVTRLRLTGGPGCCEVGTFELTTRSDGVSDSMRVAFDAEEFAYSDPAGLVAEQGPVRFPRIVLDE